MESSDNLPETVQDLEKLQEQLSAIVRPLHKKIATATTAEEKLSIKEQILPPFTKLQNVLSKIKEMKQTGTTSDDLKADSPTNDQQTEDITVNAGHQATPDEHDVDEKPDEHSIFDQAPLPAVSATTDASTQTETTSDDLKADSPTIDQQTEDITVNAGHQATPDEHDVDEKPDEHSIFDQAPLPAVSATTDASVSGPPGESDWSTGAATIAPVNEEANAWTEPEHEPDPAWITSDVTMKKPTKSSPKDPAVLRFVADGQVHCFGHLDTGDRDNSVQVLPIIKCHWKESPYFGIRVKFPRPQSSGYNTLFHEEKFHTVLIKFHPKAYTKVEDRIITEETEFRDFLQHAPRHVHAKANEAFAQGTLYRITFTYEEKGIECLYYTNQYSSSVTEIQNIFNSMKFITKCQTLSIYMWKYPDLPAHLQYLYREQHDYVPSLEPYLHKYKDGKDAYVQWGKIKIPDDESRFDRWKTFQKYPDYHLMIGNAEAREKLREVDMIKQIRNRPIKMSVIQAGHDDAHYVTLMQFQNFKDIKKIIISAGKGLVTWEPAPIVKPQSELAVGEKPARDTPHGWNAWVIADGAQVAQHHGADIALFLQRPNQPGNKYKDRVMPSVTKPGEVMKSQMVYYKIRSDATVTKQILNALDNLRFKNTKGDHNAEIKRAIICGADQTVYRVVDILEGLSEDEIAGFVKNLTPSQEAFITTYCRRIFNGIAILQGPAGSGKTTIIKLLVQIANKRGLKVAIVTDSNSAADNVIDKVADRSYIAVRVHPLGLERRHLLKHARKGVDHASLRSADPEPDESGDEGPEEVGTLPDYEDITGISENIEEGGIDDPAVAAAHEDTQNADGWKDANPIIFSEFMINSALDNYNNAKMSPEDPRMKMIETALFTWLLKVIGFIPRDKDTAEINVVLDDLARTAPFRDLHDLMHKSREQELNRAEWTAYGKAITSSAGLLLERAQACVCTIAQLTMEWAEDIHFDWKIVDEATEMSEGQFVAIWGNSDLIINIGDQQQPGKTVMSKPTENPFVDQLRYSPYLRFIENNWPSFLLKEVMRSTTGLEVLCSELFYRGQLRPGKGTTLDNRSMTGIWQEKTRLTYPSLREAPQGLAYPVLLNITSRSEIESGGTSYVNRSNASMVMDYIVWVVENGIASTHHIGILTPYVAQANIYMVLFRQLDKPEHKWQQIRVGSTEWWRGKQAEFMVVDLVRASNDHGILGSVSDGRRLNMSLSRQIQALTIVGDKDCIKTKVTGDSKADKKTLENCNATNRYLIRLFKWMEDKGRLFEVPMESLSKQYDETISAAVGASEPAPASAPALSPVPAGDTGDWGSGVNSSVPW